MASVEIIPYDPTDSFRREYDQRYERYERLKDEIQYILKKELDSQQIPYHSLEGRIKTFNSFIERRAGKSLINLSRPFTTFVVYELFVFSVPISSG